MDFVTLKITLSTFYNLYRDLMNFWTALPNKSFLNIKYEDLINNQEKEIENLLSYCDLSWNDNCINFSKNKILLRLPVLVKLETPIYKSSIKSFEKYKPFLNNLFEKI